MGGGSTEEKTFQGHMKNMTSKGGRGPQDAGTSPKRAATVRDLVLPPRPLHTH